MTREDIDTLKNFSWDERDVFGRRIFEKHEEIKLWFMQAFDWFVSTVKDVYGQRDGRFIVHDINQGEHSKFSYHYEGKAIDGHFDGLTLPQMGLLSLAKWWQGIGLYPDWNQPGIHIDHRTEGNGLNDIAHWVQKNGAYLYDWKTFEAEITGRAE